MTEKLKFLEVGAIEAENLLLGTRFVSVDCLAAHGEQGLR